jgi:hypothetical protein
MTVLEWDPDQAVTYGPLDDELDGQPTIDRYGITIDEELVGEPLAVALDQEEPDVCADSDLDDQWVLIDGEWELGQLFRPTHASDCGPEEAAMHLEVP